MLHPECVPILTLLGPMLAAQLVCAQPLPLPGALTISAVSSTAMPDSATISWTTNIPATSRLDYGVMDGTLNWQADNPRFVTQHSLTMSGLRPGTTYIVRITSVSAAGEKATLMADKVELADAIVPAASESPAPATAFSATSLLQQPPPASLNAGPFGKLALTGIVSGWARTETSPVLTGQTNSAAFSNGTVLVQKTDGWLQFFVQAGAYTFPALATPFLSNGSTMDQTFGPVAVGFVQLQAAKNTSFQVGALPTLFGAEYSFTFQNLNIERGLLWNQENVINRGAQVNQKIGNLALSFSWNDGFYSGRYTFLSGLLSYSSGSHSISFAAGGNYGQTAFQSYRTPIQNNSRIYNLIYTFSRKGWLLQPYVQYTDVPANPKIGVARGANTKGFAILASHTLKSGVSLPARFEYITTSGDAKAGAINLLFGPGSNGTSVTVTPTFQKGSFFVRADLSWVRAGNYTPGYVFGSTGNQANQFRAVTEFGFVFGKARP